MALGYLVKSIKRQSATLYCNSIIPKRYNFLIRDQRFEKSLPKVDLLIVVDAASLDRVFGDQKLVNADSMIIVNIDHHKSNARFGEINYNDQEASSACEIIFNIYNILKVKINRTVAEILYAGLYSETGGFVYPNTTGSTLWIAACLVSQYIKPSMLVKKINAKTINGTRLLSKVLGTIQVKNGIGSMYVTKKMISECQADMSDTENFVSFLMAINEVKVAVFLREHDDFTRISLRSNCRIDVDRIARDYGGGGHRLAAGIKMRKPLPMAMKIISATLRKQLEDIDK